MTTLPGITARTITSARLRTRVLTAGKPGGTPVLFLHGNLSSATWWEETLLSLPAGYLGIAPDQRGFGEADPDAHIDARRGLGDLVDDAVALLDALDIARVHIVGSSMGGSVVWRLLMDHAARFLSAALVAPGSPYGFAGTRDVAGTPTHGDFAGSGAGLVRPELAAALRAGDRGASSLFSPRTALRTLIVKPPFIARREDDLVAAMLSTHCGDRDYPGDSTSTLHWPYVAPGVWGINNALSPKYAGTPDRLYTITPRVPILWLRGRHDLAVSDMAVSDPGTWGPLGLVPGYPGPLIYPPQPMLGQTRAVLDRYRAAGGTYREIVLDNVAHVPYIEAPAAFNAALHPFLATAAS